MKTFLTLLLLIPSFAWSDLSGKKIACIKDTEDTFTFVFFEFIKDDKVNVIRAKDNMSLRNKIAKYSETPNEIEISDYSGPYDFTIYRKTLEMTGLYKFKKNDCELTEENYEFFYSKLVTKYSKGNLI